jgi:hypothetical protein
LLLLAVFLLLGNSAAYAVLKTSTGSGNWNSAATWSPSGVPVVDDDVIIASGHTVTLTEAVNIIYDSVNSSYNGFGNLTVDGTLELAGFDLSVGSLSGAGSIGSASGTPTLVIAYGSPTTTFSGVFSGTGNLALAQGNTLTLSGANNYSGATGIGGTLELGAANVLSDVSKINLQGTLATNGFNETAGTLNLQYFSTIALGAGSHSLNFANSSAESWSSSPITITITGWTGTAGTSGTAGKIFVGTNGSGLTSSQLTRINFNGYPDGASILSTGEVVPYSAAAAVKYTWNVLSSAPVGTYNWSTAANWSPNGVPGASDTVIIPTNRKQVTLDMNASAQSVTIGSTLALGANNLTVTRFGGSTNFSGSVTGTTGFLTVEVSDWMALNSLRFHTATNQSRVIHRLINDLNSSTAGYAALASATANAGAGWTPIANQRAQFDGNSKNLNDLNINSTNIQRGLFSNLYGSVKNLSIGDVNIVGGDYTGALAGVCHNAELTNVGVHGSVTGRSYVGGLVGQYNGNATTPATINGCGSDANVTGNNSQTRYVGGLIGKLYYANVIYCGAQGNVTVNSDDVGSRGIAGGLVGSVHDASFTDCSASGNVTSTVGVGENSRHLGGFAGYITATTPKTYTRCYATGNISTQGLGNGGFVGSIEAGNDPSIFSSVYFVECWASGNVSAPTSAPPGWGSAGFVGQSYDASFTNCYATGTCPGWPGFTFGDYDGLFTNCYSVGGAFADLSNGGGSTFTNCYQQQYCSGPSAITGITSLTSSQMIGSAAASNMSALDFVNVWATSTTPSDGYPVLSSMQWYPQFKAEQPSAMPAQPPVVNCWDNFVFDTTSTSCQWVNTGTQPAQPQVVNCWDNFVFDTTSCQWVNTGTQPAQPTLACYETASFNTTTCVWDVTGTQPAQPTLACYETASFNTTTCAWDVTGTQPAQPPVVNCWDNFVFNTTSCQWDNTGSPNPPIVTTISACVSYNWAITGLNYTATGVYTVNIGCQDYTLNLTINPLPTVTASDVSACAGNSVSLIGNPSGGTFSVANPYSGPTTTYTYTYTDGNGCTNTSAPANIFMTAAPPVTGINMSNIGGNSAIVNWNGIPGLIFYQVRYRIVGDPGWTNGGTQAAPTTFKNLVGLQAGTDYEIEVRGFCSNSSPGPWSSTFVFQTGLSCPPPSTLFTSAVTKNSATLNWNSVPNVNYYQTRYRVETSPGVWGPWISATASAGATTKNITGLTANRNYMWQIRAICNPSPFTTGSWSTPDYFTTLASKPGDVDEVTTENHAIVYPNPVRDVLNIEVSNSENQLTIVRLFDISGRLIKELQAQHEAGQNVMKLDLSEFANGMYTVMVYGNDKLILSNKVDKRD